LKLRNPRSRPYQVTVRGRRWVIPAKAVVEVPDRLAEAILATRASRFLQQENPPVSDLQEEVRRIKAYLRLR